MDNQNPDAQNEPEQRPSPPDTFSPQTDAPSPSPNVNIPQVISNNQKPKKRWPKILGILIIIILLAAIGWVLYKKHNKNSQSNNSGATAQSKDIPLLRIGIQSADYGKLYPNMSPNEYSFLTNAQMFEGLVRYEDKSKIVPDLATDWTNPDSKNWVFTINTSVKFHDGHNLSANDVKYSLDKLIASKSDLAETFATTISSVSTVGNDKVKITTSSPDPTLLNKLTFLYIIDSNLPQGDEPSMAGTGPYQIKPGTIPTNKDVQMVAFHDYHGGVPSTQALAFGTENTEAALTKAFDDNKYDIVGSVSPDVVAQKSNATKFTSSEPDVHFLGLNTIQAGPLQKEKVREALRYAVDAAAIGKARGNEVTPLSQMIPPSIPGYNPAITPYKQDIAKAKQLLKEAGYPNGLTLRFSTSDTPKSTDEIVSEMKKAGITLTVDRHNDFDEFINYFTSGKAEMYTVDYSSDTLDGLDIYTTTISDTNYNNPKLTKLLDQAGATVDPAARLKLLQDAAVIIDQDVAVVPLSTENNLWLMNKDYDIVQDMPSSYISVYFYKVQLK